MNRDANYIGVGPVEATEDNPEGLASCQIGTIPQMSIGKVKAPRQPISLRLKLLISHEARRSLKRKYKSAVKSINHVLGKEDKPSSPVFNYPILNLQAGEKVRIRPWDQIQITLDERNDYKGCGFMLGMKQFCGTTQVVFKAVQRFVDERDLRLHRSSGVVLLEGLNCAGDERFGRCDRSCFFFWREEWLERVPNGEQDQNLEVGTNR